MELKFTAGLPPSLNNAYTNGHGHGRRVLTKIARDYKAVTIQQIQLHCRTHNINGEWAGKRIKLCLMLHFPDNRRTDISNRVKILEDAIAEALYFDDCDVDWLLVRRGDKDRGNPRCEVELSTL